MCTPTSAPLHLPHQEALSSHCSVRPPQLLLSSLHPPLSHPHPLLHPGTACCMSLGPMCWVDLAPCWDSLMSSTRGKTGEWHLLLVDQAFCSASIQWRDLPSEEGSDPPPHSCGLESEVSVQLPHQEALFSLCSARRPQLLLAPSLRVCTSLRVSPILRVCTRCAPPWSLRVCTGEEEKVHPQQVQLPHQEARSSLCSAWLPQLRGPRRTSTPAEAETRSAACGNVRM